MKIFFKQNYAFKQTKTTIQNDKMDQNLEKCTWHFLLDYDILVGCIHLKIVVTLVFN